jgi:hypothetical protein
MVRKETNFLLQLCATSHRVSVAPHIFAELLGVCQRRATPVLNTRPSFRLHLPWRAQNESFRRRLQCRSA